MQGFQLLKVTVDVYFKSPELKSLISSSLPSLCILTPVLVTNQQVKQRLTWRHILNRVDTFLYVYVPFCNF